MTDVTLPGTGQAIAADTVGASNYQRIKVAFGTAGSATDANLANPFPVHLRDGTGALIDSLSGGGTGANGMLAATGATFFYFSSGNSTTTQLGAGATFPGAIESILNAQAFPILCTSDQNGTLTLIQYIDAGGTRIAKTTVTQVLANIPLSYCEIANGNYFKATFQNTGSSTTTTLNLNVYYGTLPPVSNLGNSPSAINEINGTAISVGQKTAALSFPVTLSNENVQDLYFTGQAAQTAAVNNIIPSTVSSNATDCTGYRSGYVQIYCPAGTYTTGAIIFEGANDSAAGAIFQTIPVFLQSTGVLVNGAITLTTTTSIGYTFPVSFRYIRVRISTAVTGGGTVQAFSRFCQAGWQPPFYTMIQPTAANLAMTASIASAQTLATVTTVGTVSTITNTGQLTPGTAAANLGKAEDAVAASGDTGVAILALRNDALTSNVSASGDYALPVVDIYGALLMKDQQLHKRTYRAAFVVTPAATATDIFQLIGSATTAVEITAVRLTATQTTGGMGNIFIKKRSTANTGGTSTASTNVPLLSTDAAATAVGSIYTANPTTGTDVGNIAIQSIPISAVTATTNNLVSFEFGDKAKPLILSGVAQAMAINLNSITYAGGSFQVTVEWTEY